MIHVIEELEPYELAVDEGIQIGQLEDERLLEKYLYFVHIGLDQLL